MVSDRDLRYYSNYYDIINKFLLMKVSVETCFCIPEKLEGECFENIDEETLTKLKQIAEDLYDDIKELTKLNQYDKDINGIILKKIFIFRLRCSFKDYFQLVPLLLFVRLNILIGFFSLKLF